MVNFFEAPIDPWVQGEYEIALEDDTKEKVSGVVNGVWGIHFDGIHTLTYIPNGRTANDWSATQDELKELASILDKFLVEGKMPANPAAMKKAMLAFKNR